MDPMAQSLDEMDFLKGASSAAQMGDVEKLRRILLHHKSSTNHGGRGYTPLHYAARNNHLSCAELLLDHGFDTNAVTGAGGATPLHRAAYMGHMDMVRLLVARGADVTILDADGLSPGQKAARKGHASVAEYLAQQEEQSS